MAMTRAKSGKSPTRYRTSWAVATRKRFHRPRHPTQHRRSPTLRNRVNASAVPARRQFWRFAKRRFHVYTFSLLTVWIVERKWMGSDNFLFLCSKWMDPNSRCHQRSIWRPSRRKSWKKCAAKSPKPRTKSLTVSITGGFHERRHRGGRESSEKRVSRESHSAKFPFRWIIDKHSFLRVIRQMANFLPGVCFVFISCASL